jgi:hypothetical protein
MDDIYTDYCTLIGRFLDGELSANEFRDTYLSQFKNEERQLDECLYEALQNLFGEVDMFTTDPALLRGWPHLYIGETVLRKRAQQTWKQLQKLKQRATR